MPIILLAGMAQDLEASIRRRMANQGHMVLVASDERQMFRAIEQSHPALVILGPSLASEGHGAQVCSELRGRCASRNLGLIVVSDADGEADKLDAFAAGADDYLALPFHMPELLLRSEALLRRQRLVRQRLAGQALRRHGDLTLDPQTGEVWRGERRVVVTPIEARLLGYLMSCAGRTVSAEELLQQVWTQAPGAGDPALVRVHIQHLRTKLADLAGANDIVRTIPRFGYCMVTRGTP